MKAWPREDTYRLLEMVEESKSAREIADALGKSRNAVLGKAHRLRVRIACPPMAECVRRQRASREKLVTLRLLRMNRPLSFENAPEADGVGQPVFIKVSNRKI